MNYHSIFNSFACIVILATALAQRAKGQYWTNDATFSPSLEGSAQDAGVNILTSYPGGKLLLTSSYAMIDGHDITNRLACLNADGTFDNTFQSPLDTVALRAYADGKILVARHADASGFYQVKRLLADGSLDSSFAGITINAGDWYAIGTLLLADGRTVVYGDFTTVNAASRIGLVILKTDGSVDSTFNSPLPNSSGHPFINYVEQTADGHLVISGQLTPIDLIRKYVLRLDLNGTIDSSFDATSVTFQGIPGRLYPQSDGKLLVYSGNQLMRLTQAGTKDSSFALTLSGTVSTFGTRRSDGKIFYTTYNYVGSDFMIQLRLMNPDGSDFSAFPFISSLASGVSKLGLPVLSDDGGYFEGPLTDSRAAGRLQISHIKPDGSIDTAYSPRFSRRATPQAYVQQPDGKHLIAGYFDHVDNTLLPQTFNAIRLNADGTRDSAFNSTLDYAASHLALQPSGKILVEGTFADGSGGTNYIIRLNADGSPDASFHSITQSYGKSAIGVSGEIYLYTNESTPRLRRYTTEGLLDTSFDASALVGIVLWIAPRVDGSVVLATVDSHYFNHTLVKLNPDGLVASNFSNWFGYNVVGFSAMPDGSLFICQRIFLGNGCYFKITHLKEDGVQDYTYNSTLSPTSGGSLSVNLEIGGIIFDMLRAAVGNSPALVRVELSLGGQPLTFSCRSNGGLFIRDAENVSNYFYRYQRTSLVSPSVETKPAILDFVPRNIAYDLGAFYGAPSVTVSGLGPFTYQWRKNSIPISGATSLFFNISSLQASDAGAYSVVVSNSAGSVITGSDLVSLYPPLLPTVTSQPVSQSLQKGRPATFTVSAYATPNPTFQWKKDGVAIANAIENFYTISSIQVTDAGNYTVVVTNAAGSITSTAATLTVRTAPVSDFNGDGQADILWQNVGSGDHGIWVMNGVAPSAWINLPVIALAWQIVGTGDFNADGQTDILWENVGSGDRGIWIMNGTVPAAWINLPSIALNWRIVGTGDFNGDGQTDILWENVGSGDRGMWIMNGTVPAAWINLPSIALNWRIVGTGDFNGDGQTDILWENVGSGDRGMWIMNATVPAAWINLPSIALNWQIAGAGDYNGDGQTDILWENVSSGDRGVWIMNGTVPSAWINLPTLTLDWRIAM